MVGRTNAVSGSQIYDLGTGMSFDVSGIVGYENFTADNFIVCASNYSYKTSAWLSGQLDDDTGNEDVSVVYSKEYSNGILTITQTGVTTKQVNSSGASGTYAQGRTMLFLQNPRVYLVRGEIKEI